MLFLDNRIGLLDTDQYGYYAYRQHGNLMLLDNGLPTIGACLMMRKNHPLMGRLNSAIKFSRSKLSSILRKYQDFARRFGNVPNPGEFRALSEFLNCFGLLRNSYLKFDIILKVV